MDRSFLMTLTVTPALPFWPDSAWDHEYGAQISITHNENKRTILFTSVARPL
jgi:hypothetical protein